MKLPDYITSSPVIIVERNYKGELERFALTPSEFHNKYGYLTNMEHPSENGASYTLKPMVHIWYKMTFIGSKEWNNFFGDMTYGLSEDAVVAGERAYIRSDLMESLTGFCHPYN